MKQYLKNIIPISIFFFMFSCSEPIDLKVDGIDKKIVLNSLINPDSTINIHLSKSISVLDIDKNIELIKNAKVKIFENDILKEDVQFDTLGYYSSSVYPQIGKEYKVTVDYSPLQSVDAITIVNSLVPITSIDFKPSFDGIVQTWYDTDTGEAFDTTIYRLNNLQVETTFNDPADAENYYLLTFSALMPQYRYYPPNYEAVFIGNKMSSIDYDSENLSWENYFSMDNFSGFAISDELFNGNTKTIKASLYMGGEYYGDELPQRNDKVFINLNSISKEFYQYIISYSKYEDIEGNPFAEPVNIMSNVNNGLGFFSSYSTAKDSIVINYPDE